MKFYQFKNILLVILATMCLFACGAGKHTNAGGGNTKAPKISFVSPTNGATNIQKDTLISITFDKAMKIETVNSNTIFLKGLKKGNNVPLTLKNSSSDQQTFTFTHGGLEQNIQYSIEIVSNQISDIHGNKILSQDKLEVSKFTTIADNVYLESIHISPKTPTIHLGTNQQFTAEGIYSDKTKLDITSTVIWTSSNKEVAIISDALGNKGLAESIKVGSTIIMVALGSISESTKLDIIPAGAGALRIIAAETKLQKMVPLDDYRSRNIVTGLTYDFKKYDGFTRTAAVAALENRINIMTNTTDLLGGVCGETANGIVKMFGFNATEGFSKHFTDPRLAYEYFQRNNNRTIFKVKEGRMDPGIVEHAYTISPITNIDSGYFRFQSFFQAFSIEITNNPDITKFFQDRIVAFNIDRQEQDFWFFDIHNLDQTATFLENSINLVEQHYNQIINIHNVQLTDCIDNVIHSIYGLDHLEAVSNNLLGIIQGTQVCQF